MEYQGYTFALWKREFTDTLVDFDDGLSSRQAVECLRFLIGTGLVALDDIQNDPRKFFLAHRMLAKHVPRIGSGLWIRFTLHYNMFAGTVLALGSPHQVKHFLLRNEVRPSLGCFALTEQGTVGSSRKDLLVETTASLSQDGTYFTLHTPYDGAAKTWISQGLVADEAIVIANLIVHDNSYGPHAFLVKLRDERGHLLNGITMLDLGPKDNGSDLDNARITFDRVLIPLSAHLCRYLEIKNGVVRHPLGHKVRVMNVIGQKIYPGRVTIAQAALSYARAKLEQLSNKADASRICWTPVSAGRRLKISPDGARLSKGFLPRAFRTLDTLDRFLARIEVELCQCLMHGKVPKEHLQRAIAVAKVEAVETCIDICNPLERNDSPGRDFLRCCKFTEGETHTLMKKMARDLVQKGGKAPNEKIETALANLKEEMLQMQMTTGCSATEAWEECSEFVFAVSDAYMDTVLESYGCLE